MDLKGAVAVATRQVKDQFAADVPRDVRLEAFLYDDHLRVWSLTIGFSPGDQAREPLASVSGGRSYKVVRVSEADKAVLSITDQ